VLHPRALPDDEFDQGLVTNRQHDQFVQTCNRQLPALVPADAATRGIEPAFEVVEAEDTAKAIWEAARRFGTDIVCIGSHGHTGGLSALFGSVAGSVMKQSSRPLLIVRPPHE